MEYRCRLGTPGGDIIEGIYVADNEARLRREFEEKGLLVLAIHAAGRRAVAGIALPRRRKVATREFLVFNQELATLLKAGMPLVQSLDILRRRITNPIFKGVLDDVYAGLSAALAEAKGPRTSDDDLIDKLSVGVQARARRVRPADLTPAVSAVLVLFNLEVGEAPEMMRATLQSEKGRALLQEGLRSIGRHLVKELIR